MQQSDAISSNASRPPVQSTALREPQRQAPSDQRVADAAAKRPSPVDEAQVSPQARELADAERQQQRTDERLQPERQQAQQQQGQAAAQRRFEVVA